MTLNQISLPEKDLHDWMEAELRKELNISTGKLEKLKTFMFMVIHDLKHPTEAMINAVEEMLKRIDEMEVELEKVKKLGNQLRMERDSNSEEDKVNQSSE